MVPHWRVIKPGSEPIPGYRVEELLGRGQFGEVWRARSPGDTLVALKFLNLGGAHGWKEFRAVQRVKQIRHPNLMPIIAIWLLDEEGAVISDDLIETIAQQIDQTASPSSTETLVIEPIRQSRRPAQMIIGNLLADQTLGDRLKDCLAGGKQGIPQDELLRYMEEAAKGLDFLNSALHQIGDSQGSVQHCDVKPDNIMLTGGSAIVADFGVAQMMAEAAGGATATSLGGTPAYMAPECFHSKTSHSTDQYSLAVTYYELRTGALPFVEQTYAAVYEAHKNGTLDFTAVSPREQAVLRKATSPDPERRYTSCLEFVMRLREAAAPPVKPRPGRRARVLSLAAILLAMAGGSALYNFVRPPSGADLASVDKQLGQQNLGAAATLAADLTDPKDAATALRKINSHISSAPQVDDNTLKQLMTALAKLRGAKFAGQLDEMSPPPLEPLRQRVEKELDGRFQTIRNNCDKWIPGSPLSDGEVTKLTDVLNTAVAVKPLSLPECERYRAALTVQRIRVEARSAKPDWSQLLSELPPLDAIQQTIERDYVVVLRYLFEATEADKKLQLTQKPAEQISTLTEQFEAYPDVRNILDRPSISKWEKDQIAGVLKSLDGRMDLDWLRQDSRLRDAVRRIPTLPSYSAAQDPDAWSLGRAAQFRREGKFSEARRELDQIGDGERARDERLALALVDPAARADLQTELGNPDFDRWERVTSLLQDQYKLSSPDTIDETKITSEQAALIKVMQSECLLHAGKDADEALDRYVERLSEPQFKPYALYIQALALEKSAAAKTGSAQTAVWSEASDKLINAYQPLLGADQQLPADSPLASSERRTRARAILFQAISRWSGDKRPTDNDYGSSTVFGGHAAQAFKNLALVRKLTGPQSVRQDYLLAAAVAAWDEVVDPANAAELLSISNELIQSAEPDAKLQPLLGTVYAARCKAQVVSQASTQSLLESAAEALQRLYLDALPPANDPAALAEARLKRIESDLIKPVLPAADAMWNKRADDPKSDASASPLARFYRAAGFMFREPCIADPLRLRGDSPDEWAYQYLQRANDLSAEPHPQTLIAQGRSLWDVRSTHPDSGKDMTELAMRAIGAAPSEPAVLARAYGLEALGRLTLARDERFSTDQRKTNLAGALARINEAIAIAQQASEPPAEFAAWLVTRATINVEFANHGGPDPIALLTSARDDAQQAVKLQLSENPHFAYLALGNALEDLAFYQCLDAEENYQRACESFQKAVELTQPVGPVSLHDEKHLSALRALLRCRQRWADSGALQSPSEEIEQLESARADASSLVFLDPQETVVEDLDPHNGANIAELCYFRSLAYRGLAARSSDDAERRALTASADADLLNAVEWARLSSAWESWAQYQLVLGRLQKDSGKLDAAAAAYQSVLELEQPQGVQLPPKLIFDALVLLSRCNKDQGQPWTSERWDNERARFSADFPSSEYYNLSCRICKMAALQPDAWEQAEIDAIDVLVNDLARDESTFLDIEDLRYNWLSCQVFRAVALADLAAAQIKEQKDIQLKRQKLSESLEHQKVAADLCAQALAIKDRALMATAAQPLEQLQDGGMDWDAVMALPGSVRKALFNHLARTFELRRRLVEANVTLISHYPKDELIRQSGQRSLQLAPKELAKEFPGVVPPDWAQKYPLYLAAFSKRS